MTFSSELTLLSADQIVILRDDRQRREIDVSDLLPSIKKNGLINPVVITRERVLIAGERRLESCRQLGIEVPCRYVDDLSPVELQLIEAEENFKRRDLSWQDQVNTIGKIHDLFCSLDPRWTMGETADRISLTISVISESLTVRNEMRAEAIANAGTRREAYNAIQRKRQRALGNDLEELLGDGPPEETIVSQIASIAVEKGIDLPKPKALPEPSRMPDETDAIQQADFIEWSATYKGDPFNLIHCDFPYGANMFGGPQGSGDKPESELYNDDKETYFELLEAFCKNFDNFASFSTHVVFWFSFRHYDATRAMFRNYVPSLEFTLHPLIWGKSDNAGIISDSRRDPRHTYEMALLGRRGGRNTVRAVSDLYNAPSDRSQHASTKPEPMLRHFFTMLCDEHSSVLDPTCGSGSSIRAAESLGAARVLGLELNPEHVANARQLLRNARVLRKASDRVSRIGGALQPANAELDL